MKIEASGTECDNVIPARVGCWLEALLLDGFLLLLLLSTTRTWNLSCSQDSNWIVEMIHI